MQAYTDAANAKLPLTKPDPVLLALVKGDPQLGCSARCVRDGKPDACRDDHAAAPSPPTDTTLPAAIAPREFSERPMALAGPKAETDAQPEQRQVAPKRQARTPNRSKRRARTENWAAKVFRNSPN